MVDKKKPVLFIISGFIFVFLLFDIVHSEIYDENMPVDCEGDRIEYSEGSREVKVLGNVVIKHKDVRITADKVIVYPESKDVYAAGRVFLYKKDEVFSADKIYYNLETKKGTLIHGDFHSGKIFGEAATIEKLSDKELLAIKGYFTTCEFEVPHYRIETKKIRIYLNERVTAKNVVFYVGSIPVMYFPYYSHSLKENKPKVQIIPGKDKEWGYFLLTAWRYYFDERLKGWVRVDWREKLGFGGGVDVEYNAEKFGQGLLKTYYTQERSRHLKEYEPAEHDKYRVSLEHNLTIDKDTKAYLELHKYSDQTFIKDYFYRDYVLNPLPTSYILATRKKAHYSLSFLMRKRVNHFRNITETLPEIKYNINNYKLGKTRFYYTSEYRFNNFNKKEAFTGNDTDTVRFHTDNRFSYPTRLIGCFDWLEFTPYIGHIETFYTKDGSGNDNNFFRGQWYSGYNLTTKVFRIFDVETDFLGIKINKLRHLISPSISYTYAHEPTSIFSKMGQFDGIDTYTKAKYYTFALENKLQTKWHEEGTFDKEDIDLLSLRSSVNFYPQIEGHQFSNITNRLMLQPRRWLEFIFDANYNPYSQDFEIFNARAKAEKSKWMLEVGSRYTQVSQYHEGTLKATYTISPKWTVGIYERYDFQKKDLAEQEYALIRDLHCWTAEIIWNVQDAETIWLVFRPKAFPDFPIEWVNSYHAPKIGSQSAED